MLESCSYSDIGEIFFYFCIAFGLCGLFLSLLALDIGGTYQEKLEKYKSEEQFLAMSSPAERYERERFLKKKSLRQKNNFQRRDR